MPAIEQTVLERVRQAVGFLLLEGSYFPSDNALIDHTIMTSLLRQNDAIFT